MEASQSHVLANKNGELAGLKKSAEQHEQKMCSVHRYHSSSSNSRQNGKHLIRSQQTSKMLNKASAINKECKSQSHVFNVVANQSQPFTPTIIE